MKYLTKIAQLLLIFSLALTPIIWFKGRGNVLINGIDTNFPLDPWMWFLRRFYVWTDFPNAGQDFSSSTAGIFFHLIQVIPYKSGFAIQQVEIISLIFWFALIVGASYILARTLFARNFLIQLLFVVLYTFNVYIFNTWENVKVANLALISAIPLGVSILVLLIEKKLLPARAVFFSSLVGIILSGSGINPSYFITFILIMVIFALSYCFTDFKLKTLKQVLLIFLLTLLPIILINLFWILPTTNFVTRNIDPAGSIDKIGFNNWLDSLSENTSLLNVMRSQGAWDWYAFDGVTGLPLYIPYVLNYFYRVPFIAFSFLLPMLVIISLCLINKSKNYIYIAFGIMFILGVFLGTGTHLPTGTFFRWLSQHLPFFTIFRSPWYIFTPLVILSASALICLLFVKLENDLFKRSGFLKSLIPLFVLILILGNLVYSYPLVTGKIFRPDRPDGFFVEFPRYLFDAKSWLDTQENGRIIGYPDDEIEQFSWGYRGIESILGLLTNHETLFNPLNAPDSNSANLVKQFYRHIKRGEIEAANSIASKLNIGLIFEKTDQPTLAPSLPLKIKENIIASFGPWNFFGFPNQITPKITSPKNIFAKPEKKTGAAIIGAIDRETILFNDQDSVLKGMNGFGGYLGKVVLAKNSQEEELRNLADSESKLSNRLVLRDLSKVEFSVDITEGGDYSPILERYSLENFGIEIDKPLEVKIDGNKVVLDPQSRSDSYIYFKKISMSAGEHKIKIQLKNQNLISGGDFNSGTIFTKGGYGEGRGEYTINEDSNGKFLQIFNLNKANVSADFPVFFFDPLVSYYVEVRYKQIYGNNSNVVVFQGTKSTLVKAQTERLPNYPEWNVFSFYYEPVQTDSNMRVDLEAPFTSDPLGTKILYDDLKVFKVFTNKLILIKENNTKLTIPNKIEFKKVSPVNYRGEVSGNSGPHVIVLSENYSQDWELVVTNRDETRLPIKNQHLSANLFANAWYIDNASENYKFEIFYKPQRLFWLGSLISLITLVAGAVMAFVSYRVAKDKNP